MIKYILSIFIGTLLFTFQLPGQSYLLKNEFSNPDFSTPKNINSHIFNFFHHSVGGGLLSKGLSTGLETLGYTLHSKILTRYEYENNYEEDYEIEEGEKDEEEDDEYEDDGPISLFFES